MITGIGIKGNQYLSAAPQFGTVLIKERGEFKNYWHEKRALGGDWAAGFEVMGDYDMLLGLFDTALLGMVEAYSEDGIRAWHGYVSAMTLETPFGIINVDINDIANRVRCNYTNSTGGTVGETVQEFDNNERARLAPELGSATPTESTTYNDTESQARYGIKHEILSAGECNGATIPNQIAQTFLADHAFPQSSLSAVSINTQSISNEYRLKITCEGWIRTLNWQPLWISSGSTTVNVSAQIASICTNEFITDTEIVTNTTQVLANNKAWRKRLDLIFDFCRLGDSSFNQYVCYVIDGVFYYQQAASTTNSDLRYAVRRVDDKLRVFENSQSQIPLELVEANEYIKVEPLSNDFVKRQYLNDDDATAYIEGVAYRDDSESLEIQGSRSQLVDIMLNRTSIGSNRGF